MVVPFKSMSYANDNEKKTKSNCTVFLFLANLNPTENRCSPHLFITSAHTGETDNKDFNNLQVNTVHPKHFP